MSIYYNKPNPQGFTIQKTLTGTYLSISNNAVLPRPPRKPRRNKPKPFDPSLFSGIWKGEDIAANINGSVKTIKTVTLTTSDTGYITGSVGWIAATNVGHDSNGVPVSGNVENVSGLVNKQTGEINLVEHVESGTFRGRLHGSELHLVQTQPGGGSNEKPVVAIMKLNKIA